MVDTRLRMLPLIRTFCVLSGVAVPMRGGAEAVQADDVAMGEGSILQVGLVVVALKAANDPIVAKERKAAASHMLLVLLLLLSF